MTAHPHRQPWRRRLADAFAARAGSYRSRSLGWRLLAPAVFVLAGALFVTSMVSAQGTDLRAGRYDDLAGLASSQARDLEQQRQQAASLTDEVDRLTRSLTAAGGDAWQTRADALQDPAGLTAVSGPGVTITLSDAPDAQVDAAGDDVSSLLVHQQDIQAVANALWAGGATAMTLQGQRVVATTGIKCVGNTVILHGVPYSPPYKISAVGPISPMLTSVLDNGYVKLYLQVVDAAGLGWDVQQSAKLDLPGYDGPTEMEFARTARASGDR